MKSRGSCLLPSRLYRYNPTNTTLGTAYTSMYGHSKHGIGRQRESIQYRWNGNMERDVCMYLSVTILIFLVAYRFSSDGRRFVSTMTAINCLDCLDCGTRSIVVQTFVFSTFDAQQGLPVLRPMSRACLQATRAREKDLIFIPLSFRSHTGFSLRLEEWKTKDRKG